MAWCMMTELKIHRQDYVLQRRNDHLLQWRICKGR